MNQSIKDFWQQAHITETRLLKEVGREIFLMSVEQPGLPDWREGRITVVAPRVAGIRLTEHSHRLATSEEIAAYKADQEEKARAAREAADLRAGRKVIAVEPAVPGGRK